MAHTPGPWTYTLEKRDKSWPGLYALRTDLLEFGWDGEEGIYIDNPDDAHLMFAAPEMLDLLKAILQTKNSSDWHYDRLTSLIAKAEGVKS